VHDEALNSATGLAYDLPPVDRDRHLAGPVAARLFVSTSKTDAFLNVRLQTVAPDGVVTALTDGNDTLSFRALDEARTRRVGGLVVRPFHPYTSDSVETIEPGAVYEWWIEVHPVAARIPAGHVLRVTIQPSDAAQAVPVGERGVGLAGAVVSIHHDAERPSAIVVPFTAE
jgi:predicted acyl esterase